MSVALEHETTTISGDRFGSDRHDAPTTPRLTGRAPTRKVEDTRMSPRSHLALMLCLALAACDSPPPPVDAAADDAGMDAGSPDVGNDAWAGFPDGGPGVDPHWGERQDCFFAAGAMPADTLGDLAAARAAITHVIVIVQENRSVDHMYGMTGHGIEGIPAGFTVPDRMGNPVAPFHETTACTPDIGHQWLEIHTEWDNGMMDGFVRADGMGSMGYFTDADHPFYTWMLTTFATSDRYFSSVLSGTYPNRAYLYMGTSDGVHCTGCGYPDPSLPTIFTQLDDASIGWAEYNASTTEVLSGTFGWHLDHPGVHVYSELLPALDAGTLPPVSFVDLEPDDEHPPGSIHAGEIGVREVITHAFASPLWPHLAILFTYDENGGFFDHVPPPTACLASPSERDFNRLGLRVPVAIVSPYARAGFVSHDTHSHTSMLRFLQAIYDLPALTGRDANSDAMLDMFDFDAAAFMTPPAAVPDAAAAGCGL
jgi:phospholipase C